MMTVLELSEGCSGVMQADLMGTLWDRGLDARLVCAEGARYVVVGGVVGSLDLRPFGVRSVRTTSHPFPLVSREAGIVPSLSLIHI